MMETSTDYMTTPNSTHDRQLRQAPSSSSINGFVAIAAVGVVGVAVLLLLKPSRKGRPFPERSLRRFANEMGRMEKVAEKRFNRVRDTDWPQAWEKGQALYKNFDIQQIVNQLPHVSRYLERLRG